ncbi:MULTISPECIES: M23 family metallopeptidase [unclassified Achromobacter]|uniref:M23 family metallopeptidase n=1 Tax=unclassified Achromobacter TaxID=2626865 RepID=UPI000B51DC02|nr:MULTISPECIES: M23 family metallopeptidase [unclassified Achromobacter]OWT73005.1 peptidase M23 [Achromobacter sp. HZ34]OWT73896.1 peptidase M23 [Achromobacter sp. HZ28]
MHARGGSDGHLTLGGSRLALLLGALLALAAMIGAYSASMYRNLSAPQVGSDATPLASEQAVRNAAFVRDNLNMLAGRVGALQAKLIGIDALSRRLAAAAGVTLTDPAANAGAAMPQADASTGVAPGAAQQAAAGQPVMASTDPQADDVMDDNFTDRAPPSLDPGSAQALGRQLDDLLANASAQSSTMDMLDAALSRRSGDLARLPTSMPLEGYAYLSSSYGWRRNPVTGRYAMHEGVDFPAPRGTPIEAAAGGVVTEAGPESGYGNMLEIDHGDGMSTRYAHASELLVKKGDVVERGQIVARVGSTGRSTGSHLHFEVRLAGQPLDPKLFIGPPATAPPTLAAAPSAKGG